MAVETALAIRDIRGLIINQLDYLSLVRRARVNKSFHGQVNTDPKFNLLLGNRKQGFRVIYQLNNPRVMQWWLEFYPYQFDLTVSPIFADDNLDCLKQIMATRSSLNLYHSHDTLFWTAAHYGAIQILTWWLSHFSVCPRTLTETFNEAWHKKDEKVMRLICQHAPQKLLTKWRRRAQPEMQAIMSSYLDT